jgi:hypothetical protein
MANRALKISTVIFAITISGQFLANAQQKDTTLIKLTKLRNEFAGKIKSLGFPIKLNPPEIVFANTAAFANYDDSANKIEVQSWRTLDTGQKAFFNSMAQQMGNKETGKEFFEQEIYQWVFIHELGHWWSVNKHLSHTHYDEEMYANRIAAAYWREINPSLLDFTAQSAKGAMDNIPDPVPPGSSKEDYFNGNYDKLMAMPAYSWYQAVMIVSVYNENPKKTFKEAIASDK